MHYSIKNINIYKHKKHIFIQFCTHKNTLKKTLRGSIYII